MIMEIDTDSMEFRISIRDDGNKRAMVRTFFRYGDWEPCINFAYSKAIEYGVKEIVVYNGGVGLVAYDQLTRLCSAAEKPVVSLYKQSILR